MTSKEKQRYLSEGKKLHKQWKDKKGRKPKAVQKKITAYKKHKKQQDKMAVQDAKMKQLADFMEAFIRNGGNITQAALTVLPDGEDPIAAYHKGKNMLEKAKAHGMVQIYLEKQGYDFGKMLEVAVRKMEKSKKPDWWDRLMKMAGYEDFINKKDTGGKVNINLFGQHKKMMDEYVIDGDYVEAEPAPDGN